MIVVYCANLLYIQTRQFEFDDRQFLEGRHPKMSVIAPVLFFHL